MFSRTNRVTITCIALVTLGGVFQAAAADTEGNKAATRRSIEEIRNQGNMAVVNEIFASNYVYHEPAMGDLLGPEGLKQAVLAYRTAYPDLYFTVEDMLTEGDIVVTRWTAAGTQHGELMGIPPTGLKTTTVGINFARYQDGKAVEKWSNWDVIGLTQQLGEVTPARPGAEDYLWSEASEVTGQLGQPEANKAIIMRFVKDVWNHQNLDVMEELFIRGVTSHNPPVEFMCGPGNLDTLRQSVIDYLTAYPDLSLTVRRGT